MTNPDTPKYAPVIYSGVEVTYNRKNERGYGHLLPETRRHADRADTYGTGQEVVVFPFRDYHEAYNATVVDVRVPHKQPSNPAVIIEVNGEIRSIAGATKVRPIRRALPS
jgi:hypothetical protein